MTRRFDLVYEACWKHLTNYVQNAFSQDLQRSNPAASIFMKRICSLRMHRVLGFAKTMVEALQDVSFCLVWLFM
jgi:hypothetical protein